MSDAFYVTWEPDATVVAGPLSKDDAVEKAEELGPDEHSVVSESVLELIELGTRSVVDAARADQEDDEPEDLEPPELLEKIRELRKDPGYQEAVEVHRRADRQDRFYPINSEGEALLEDAGAVEREDGAWVFDDVDG